MTSASPIFVLDLDRAVLALSEALDLVGVDRVGHGHRVALMAAMVAEQLGWDDPAVHDLVLAGLLHDCGVSSTRDHRKVIGELDSDGTVRHCELGADYVSAVPELARLSPIVLEHHTHWADLIRRKVAEPVARAANLIFLADRADALRVRGLPPGREVAEVLAGKSGFFAPEAMAQFDMLARREAFWFVQEEPALHEALDERLQAKPPLAIDFTGVRGLAAMFGRVIDAKSPFTERHSQGVARVARKLGECYRLPAGDLDCLEIAGMLHDIGKLRIPDELLDKQGPLTHEERMRMARHAFDTWEILRHVFGDGPVAQWAAFHHESVSGQGYPFHREGAELPLGARIVAVADVFQALAQQRPYRAPMTPEEIAPLLDGMVFAGKLDRQVVETCKANLAACHAEAMKGEGVG